ncbi:MAG: class I SAM-dependent methyltransferase [Cellulomonas sp.]|uniref:class I SAM-dependent methyltransferase n=1 Tax=Cellulomonas sp. 73-92 TaxID=1895740 RepID=UPI00092C817D|nr:class I SAM-dependent methyltransferase [Cellulomonas sp. 73-92]MBN9375699.1 class I SAM-dependent methyltransferase [Cellulomonas sp.]OJV75982.1 MAG: methyltransferase type 11 [Cellulomonas sp. 73-92]
MPVMSAVEATFCRSALWRSFAGRRVLPWVLADHLLTGEVLEIGGGVGAMAAETARRFPITRLTVIDVDPVMVEVARSRLARFGNVTVARADVTNLPFEPASFDAVTSYLMLHHVIDWTEALTQIAQVLRPGGALIGYDLTDTRLARVVHRADGSPHRILTPAELADGLALAGFAQITIGLSWHGHLMRFHALRRSGTPETLAQAPAGHFRPE